jgi:hypothetical protein
MAEGQLRLVLTAFEPQPALVSLLHAGQGLLPHKLRSFLDFAVPRLARSLAGDQAGLAAQRGGLAARAFLPH